MTTKKQYFCVEFKDSKTVLMCGRRCDLRRHMKTARRYGTTGPVRFFKWIREEEKA